jgi:hypothetical protein
MLARSLVAISLVAAVAIPVQAQARFGKRSSSSSSSDSSDSTSADSSSDEVHAATPVEAEASDPGDEYVPPCPSDCGYEDSGWAYYAYEPEYVPPPPYEGSGAAARVQGRGWNVRAALMSEVQGFSSGDGGLFSAGMLIEGVKWGVDVDVRLIRVAADDGSGETDSLRLLNGMVTWTLFGSQTSRIRLEGGFTAAFAPDVIVISPQVGASMAFGFGGPWGVEGLVRASLVPHTQLEWSAGFSYAMGAWGLRAGWRRIFLDDRGIVDGVAHQDEFAGPYVGLGVAF